MGFYTLVLYGVVLGPCFLPLGPGIQETVLLSRAGTSQGAGDWTFEATRAVDLGGPDY